MEEVKIFVQGRVGLIGEVSDLVAPYLSQNKELIEGHVIAFPIDKGIYSKCKKSEKIIYRYKDRQFECELSEERLRQEAEEDTFFSYVCGTILYIIQKYDVSGIEIEIEKMDLPIAKGLSSSAAICITLAKAYNELYKLNLTDQELKNIAYNGEHLAQSQCGRLDQETIMNKAISHIIFGEKEVKSEEIFVKKDIYILILDLNKGKDTKAIMKAFNNALPFAQSEEEKIIHDIIGPKNKELVEMSVNAIETGDIPKLGKAITEAQNMMDKATSICNELKAPIFHKVINDETVEKNVYGAKSCGSGGDGTAILICKDEEAQKKLEKYIKEKYKMDTIKTKIEKTPQKVTIIGAGPAGLTTAYHLLKNDKNYDITILEQDSQVGGISKTVNFNGYKMDTGIHRFFTKNSEVEQTWEELLPIQSKPAYDDILLERKKQYPEHGSDPENEEKSMLIKDRVTRIYYGKKFYDYPVSLNFTTIKNMGFLTLIKAGFSYLKSCIFKKKEDSLENFYINRFGKVLYSMFFESYTEKVWGIHPLQISADWGAQRVKGLSITAVIKDIFKKIIKNKNNNNTETSLIEQFIYPKLGAGQVYEEMAKKIEEWGGKIYLNSTVTKIVTEQNNISKVLYIKDGIEQELKTDICISSMPIKDLIMGMENYSIPEEIYNIAVNLPYREFMAVGLIVPNLNLKNNTKFKTLRNIIPDSWIYVQEPDVKMGRLQVFNNWSPYIFKNKEDIKSKVFISLEYFCSENDEYWNMSDEEFIKFAEEEAVKIGLIDKNSVEEAIRIKINKAYPAYFGTYSEINKVVEFLNKFDNLYCIGRNGQHRYNNMDHSMLTGIETAKSILNGENDKTNIWNVNTEQEYHEVKVERNGSN